MDYHTPGVHIREIDAGPRPIASVATAVAGFLGLFPHRPTIDAVAIQATDGTTQLTGKVLPQLVDTSGGIAPGNAAGAAAALTSAFRLRRTSIKDLRKLLDLNGHKATIGRGADGGTRITVGQRAVEVDASVVNTEGKVISPDQRAVEGMLDTVHRTFPLDGPQPRSAKDLLEVYGLAFQGVRGTSLVGEYSVPPYAVTNKSEFSRWLQSYYAQYLVETRSPEELVGRSFDDLDEAADAVFEALSASDTLAKSFAAWLSQPGMFAFTSAVNGFYDNGGGKAYVYLMGTEDPGASIRENQPEKLGLFAFDDCDDLALHVGAGLAPHQQRQLLEHCEARKDRFAVLDGPLVSTDDLEVPPSAGGFGAMYVPWVAIQRPSWYSGSGLGQAEGSLRRQLVKSGPAEVHVPPSGHIAGVFARVDAERGVHKAPANELVMGITGLSQSINRQELGQYNDRGVNVIRAFSDRGIRVWGARTLATHTERWRHVHVRRLFIMVEQSVSQGMQWAVYEPNDAFLWSKLTRDVRAYLLRVWRSRALLGSTPEAAFYVKCDAETNPQYLIDAGQINLQIGLSPVKPAEFVVFSIGQWDGGSLIDEG